MISVQEAQSIISNNKIQLTTENVALVNASGRILKEEIFADQDFPAFNRVMMDGIAINFDAYSKAEGLLKVEGIQLAGTPPRTLQNNSNCVEIMTGAPITQGCDTVIRYEDVEFIEQNGERFAKINVGPKKKGQNVHPKGSDQPKGASLLKSGVIMGPAEVAVAATVGKTTLSVSQLPKIAIISTGDELVDIDQTPLPHQIRKSNVYAISSALDEFKISPEIFHLSDNKQVLLEKIEGLLEKFDILVLSGGVSKGKADYIPEVLSELGVQKLFHRVAQKPGKPFWFGKNASNKVVFAFPGNPVSTYLCYYKYLRPWLKSSMGQNENQPIFAQLQAEVTFKPPLTYFLQVKSYFNSKGVLVAEPYAGRGSGDHANLLSSTGFLELPQNQESFQKGKIFQYIPFKGM
ncbi:molybdopterin molybdotransferase MoeA [Flexithrix dorotheae]|uniref:molybdopterin molybdotransferase MoeA n=1 Tax=Flexithrix dorotheae TaxID=70993 RepID=UPI00037506B7|nr:molybdopterin molybdotransferase MoeA [Flexithrix dorotheae]